MFGICNKAIIIYIYKCVKGEKGIAALSVMQLEKIWDRKHGAEQELEYWTAKLEEAKVLLSEKLNQKELLTMLHPGVTPFLFDSWERTLYNVGVHSLGGCGQVSCLWLWSAFRQGAFFMR